jgi:hypothetical protein
MKREQKKRIIELGHIERTRCTLEPKLVVLQQKVFALQHVGDDGSATRKVA